MFEKTRVKWACDPQNALLRYFLRVDPGYGIAQVADALQQRQATGCYRSLLTDLKSAIRIPELEQLAITALNDSSVDVARSAADVLGHYGSAAAEAALWQRMERFHETWKDRTNELRTLGPRDTEGSAAATLEFSLIAALTQGESWVVDADKLDRLKALASPARQNGLESRLSDWRPGPLYLSLSWPAGGNVSYHISGYSGDSVDQLARRIRQFPSGTRMSFALSSSDEATHHADIEIVRDAAKAAGVLLEITRID